MIDKRGYCYIGDTLLAKDGYSKNAIFTITQLSFNQDNEIQTINVKTIAITEDVLFYNMYNLNGYYGNIILLNSNDININYDIFSYKDTTYYGIQGNGIPTQKPSGTNIYLDLNTGFMYKYISKWVKMYTCLIDLYYINISDGNMINIFFDVNSYGTFYVYQMMSNNQYNGNYTTYYSTQELDSSLTSITDLLWCLNDAKKSMGVPYDLLLIKYDGLYNVFIFYSILPLNVLQLRDVSIGEYIFFDASKKTYIYIENNVLTEAYNVQFDPNSTDEEINAKIKSTMDTTVNIMYIATPVLIVGTETTKFQGSNYVDGYINEKDNPTPPDPNENLKKNTLVDLYVNDVKIKGYRKDEIAGLGIQSTENNFTIEWYSTFPRTNMLLRQNPFNNVNVTYNSSGTIIDVSKYLNSAGYTNKIKFEGIVYYGSNLNPTNLTLDTYYLINNDLNKGNILYYNVDLSSSEEKLFTVPQAYIMSFTDNIITYYVYNAGENNYFITTNPSFNGKILDALPDKTNYKFGDLISIKDRGILYELAYDENDVDVLEWRILCDNDRYYFTDNDTGITYVVNDVDSDYSYYFPKSDETYYVGYVITDFDNTNFVENEYYSLNFDSGSLDGRTYKLGDICLYKDGKLNVVSINNINNIETVNDFINTTTIYNYNNYSIYNKTNGNLINNNYINNTYICYSYLRLVITGEDSFSSSDTYYQLNNYNGYSLKLNNASIYPDVNYKENSYLLVYDDNNLCRLYLRYNDNYEMINFYKIIYKDKSTGKIYFIYNNQLQNNNVISQIKPGIKLNNAIESKYVEHDGIFNSTKSINLFKSTTRTIKQNIDVLSTGYIKLDIQPPLNSILINNCVSVIKNNDGEYLFNSKDILNQSNIYVEYIINGEIVTLIYLISRYTIIEKISSSSTFNGSFDFESETEILNTYILNNSITYTNLIGDYLTNGILTIPKNGVYKISITINYKYDAVVGDVSGFDNDNSPFYSLNYLNNSVIGSQISIGKPLLTNYNTISGKNFTPITNGTVSINVINSFNENDQLVIVYNLMNYQLNIEYSNGYFNLIKIN